MKKLSWDLFRVENSDAKTSFEALCKDLFARKIGIQTADLTEYHNQKGIEVAPVLYEGKGVSFQSKFNFQDSVSWSKFSTSLDSTIEELNSTYRGLKTIYHYTNGASSETSNRRKNIDSKADKQGLHIDWIFGKSILESLKEPNNSDLRKRYFGGGKNLEIFLPNTNATPRKNLAALKYQSQLTTFTGREKELEVLREFIEHTDQIKWCIMDGKGGTGKSRLALELGLELKSKGWQCGFFTSYEKNGFDSWNPEKPHLIVCDYVLGREDEIASCIRKAIQLQKNGSLDFPLRFLLLERKGDDKIREISETATFGPLIQQYLFATSPLSLIELDRGNYEVVIKDFADFFELDDNDYKDVLKRASFGRDVRNIVYAGLLCLYKYSGLSDTIEPKFEGVIRPLIDRERAYWIDKLTFGETREDYLILASMTGGIDLNRQDKLSSELSEYLIDFDGMDSYGKIVGDEISTSLMPLSHDLVNELYVLDMLSEREKFNFIIQKGLEYENGKPLLSFFTRAGNDYVAHPSLVHLMAPFSSTGYKSFIWLLIIANVIDKIDVEFERKINLFRKLNDDLANYAPGLIGTHTPILENLFIRLLNEFSKAKHLSKWIVEYKIIDLKHEEIPKADVNATTSQAISNPQVELLDSLKPKDYCKDALKSFHALEPNYRSKFAGYQLSEIYHHHTLHLLSSRTADLSEVKDLVNEIRKVFVDEFPMVLSLIYRDIIAGIYQWGYVESYPDVCAEVTLNILSILENQPKNKYVANCFSAASTVIANSLRNYTSKKSIFERFRKAFNDIENNGDISTQLIGISVSLMYGFDEQADFDFALTLSKKVYSLTNKFPSAENALNLSMATIQLLRYRGEFANKQQRNSILNRNVKIAKKHGKDNFQILQNTVRELEAEATILINEDNSKAAQISVKLIILIGHFKETDFETRLYVGGFLLDQFNYYLEEEDPDGLKKTIDNISELYNISFVDMSHMLGPLSTDFFKKYQVAKNSVIATDIYKEIADYWTKKGNPKTIDWVLNYIKEAV